MIALGIDCGTQGLTALALDGDTGAIFATAARDHRMVAGLPPGHELFEQYSFLTADEVAELPALLAHVPEGVEPTGADRTRLLSLPFKLVDARHRLGVIDEALKDKILAARAELRGAIGAGVAFFDPARYNAAATIQDNILFGKTAYGIARAEAKLILANIAYNFDRLIFHERARTAG